MFTRNLLLIAITLFLALFHILGRAFLLILGNELGHVKRVALVLIRHFTFLLVNRIVTRMTFGNVIHVALFTIFGYVFGRVDDFALFLVLGLALLLVDRVVDRVVDRLVFGLALFLAVAAVTVAVTTGVHADRG